MANSSKSCSKCEKGKGTFYCIGCETYFCKRDYDDHRTKMTDELDGFIEDRNILQQKINTIGQGNHYSNSLLTEIDDWERTTIEKIKNVAEQTRQQVVQLPNSKKLETKSQFEKFCQDLLQLKETGDFVEFDLKHLKETVHQLNQNLKRLNEPQEFELCIEQSNQIQWDTLIYIREKSDFTVKQRLQEQQQITLRCGGRACQKCNQCCDSKTFTKSDAVTSARTDIHYVNDCNCVGSCHCGYDYYHHYSDVCRCVENK